MKKGSLVNPWQTKCYVYNEIQVHVMLIDDAFHFTQ